MLSAEQPTALICERLWGDRGARDVGRCGCTRGRYLVRYNWRDGRCMGCNPSPRKAACGSPITRGTSSAVVNEAATLFRCVRKHNHVTVSALLVSFAALPKRFTPIAGVRGHAANR